MQITAQQVFKELDSNSWRPFYFIVGEEPFQAGEILLRLKTFFIKDESSREFNLESWEGEHIDAAALAASLDTLPGLFAGDSIRLVICSNFDKIPAYGLELLEGYFKRPSETTCFVALASKLDKRKSWFKSLDAKAAVLEVNEPYDREWPKWHGYLEKKSGKKIDLDAWEMLVVSSNRSLSILWSEIQKAATFAGESPRVTAADVQALGASSGGTDIFALAEDVLSLRPFEAMKKFHELVRSGESEIKILSILVRQFRLVERYLEVSKKGITDSKAMGSEIGVHPFFVSKIAAQAKHHSVKSLHRALGQLAECDYQVKTGDGGVFERFLVPYFQKI